LLIRVNLYKKHLLPGVLKDKTKSFLITVIGHVNPHSSSSNAPIFYTACIKQGNGAYNLSYALSYYAKTIPVVQDCLLVKISKLFSNKVPAGLGFYTLPICLCGVYWENVAILNRLG
jgi:hypothetical protein